VKSPGLFCARASVHALIGAPVLCRSGDGPSRLSRAFVRASAERAAVPQWGAPPPLERSGPPCPPGGALSGEDSDSPRGWSLRPVASAGRSCRSPIQYLASGLRPSRPITPRRAWWSASDRSTRAGASGLYGESIGQDANRQFGLLWYAAPEASTTRNSHSRVGRTSACYAQLGW
jgi:hypothetical protein